MKTVVYLGNSYIATLKELQEAIEKNYNGKDGKSFRKELLAYYKDQVLSCWLEEHSCKESASQLPIWGEGDETSDNDVFKDIYKVIMNKECSAELDSAFSQKAALLRCEVDGKPASFVNGAITIFSFDNPKEVRFVFKALEEIDSKMTFELEKHNSKRKPITIKTEGAWYTSGSEFSLTFGMALLGIKNEGAYTLRYTSSKHDVVCEMKILKNDGQRIIKCKNGSTILLHYINGIWITEPNFQKEIGITPVVPYDKVKLIEGILKNLNIETDPYRFRLASPREIKGLFIIGNTKIEKIYPMGSLKYYYPIDDHGKVWFWDGFSSKTNMPTDYMFVAVLDDNQV